MEDRLLPGDYIEINTCVWIYVTMDVYYTNQIRTDKDTHIQIHMYVHSYVFYTTCFNGLSGVYFAIHLMLIVGLSAETWNGKKFNFKNDTKHKHKPQNVASN